MMKHVVLGGIAATLVAGAGLAFAGGPGFPTAVELNSLRFEDGVASTDGRLTSPKKACISLRKVKIFAVIEGENELIDSGKASSNGFFAGGGQVGEMPDGIRARAPRQRLKPGVSCARGSEVLLFGP